MPHHQRRFAPELDLDQPLPGEGDVIAEIYDHVMAGADPSELRRRFAGTTIFVSAKPRLTTEQREHILRDLKHMPSHAVALKWGISERHLRRIKHGRRRPMP